MAALRLDVVVFLYSKLEILSPQIQSTPAQGSAFWLRPSGRAMLINVSTRKFGRAVRLPEGDIGAPEGSGVSKSAVSRRFVALSAARMKEWMSTDLSKLELFVWRDQTSIAPG